MIHPGHPAGCGGAGGGGCGGHSFVNGQQHCQVTPQKHEQWKDEASNRLCDKEGQVKLPTLITLVFSLYIYHHSTVEIRC